MLEKEDSINAEPLIITPVYNGPSTDVPLSVCVLQSTVFVHIFHISLWQFIHCYAANFSCCTLCMLHHFHVVLFCVPFHVALFVYCTLFILRNFHFVFFFFFRVALFCVFLHVPCCTFTRCNDFVLLSSVVAFSAFCNFFLVHFVHVASVHVAYCKKSCSQNAHRHLR